MTTPAPAATAPTTPMFSIVVATLNARALLGRTLASLQAQDLVDWELQLIDAASADGTADLARALGDARIQVLSEPDQGIADAWNKGVHRSRGRWLIFLGAGDELPANALRRLARAVPADGAPAVLYGDTALLAEDGGIQLNYGRPIAAGGPRLGFPFLHPACATHRAVFHQIGPFDTRLRIAIDGDFLLRAWRQGLPFVQADHTVVMLAGGVSDRRWLAANLEYTGCVVQQLQLGTGAARRLRWGVHLRHWVFKRLGLSAPIRKTRQTLIFAAIAAVNLGLRWLPTFALRRGLLGLARCHIHPTASVHRGVRLFSLGRLSVGANSTINRGVYLDNRRPITIGSNVSIAHDARLYTQGHDINDPFFKLRGAAVHIDDRACVFAAAMVLPGVRVGEGAVVLPGTVAQQDVPAHAVLRPTNELQLGVRSSDLRYQIDAPAWLAT